MGPRRALAVTLLVAIAAVGSARAQTGGVPSHVEYSAVEVVGFVRTTAGYEAVGWGSGALVDATGLVLTAFHVIGDPPTGRLLNDRGLSGISMVQTAGSAPVPMYLADVVTYSAALDLALLQVRMRLDGSALPGYTSFPVFPVPGLRDRTPVAGDALTAYGFSAGFDQPIVAIPGLLSRAGPLGGYAGRPWVISATLPYAGGLSGGPVVNSGGVLVGLALGPTGRGSDVQGVARPWDEILAWATGHVTATQSASQVFVAGRVVDGDTQRAIPGAVFYVLRPNVTAEDFLADPADADVVARGGTDRNGAFLTDPAVTFGVGYNMVVYAEHYGIVYSTQPIVLDDRACSAGPRCDFGVIELESVRD